VGIIARELVGISGNPGVYFCAGHAWSLWGKVGLKSPKQSGSYFATPARMILPAIPIPDAGMLSATAGAESRRELFIRGAKTLTGSPASAKERADELLGECRRRLRNGDVGAVLQLLDAHPDLIADTWVRETITRLATAGRLRRPKGRPQGRYKVHPLEVVGMIEELQRSGHAPNLERAFCKLDELGVLPYETAKALFYQVLREKRFRLLMITFPDLERKVTVEDMAEISKAEMLQPGTRSVRTVGDNELGRVEIVFQADLNG